MSNLVSQTGEKEYGGINSTPDETPEEFCPFVF